MVALYEVSRSVNSSFMSSCQAGQGWWGSKTEYLGYQAPKFTTCIAETPLSASKVMHAFFPLNKRTLHGTQSLSNTDKQQLASVPHRSENLGNKKSKAKRAKLRYLLRHNINLER